MAMAVSPCILFTAFEPSGDELAAPVVGALRRLVPDVPIYAFGGPQMAEAGAVLIEDTTQNAAMHISAVRQARAHHQRLRRLKHWLADHPVAVHVPTDAPAANWPICKMIKRRTDPQAKVVHLVAPQVWAWASWRVARLRRWSDLVLCLLPFEPAWFEQHGVKAQFIGHPLFDRPLDADEMNWQSVSYPDGRPRLALLPGSRPGEISANWPVMLRVFNSLAQHYSQLTALVAAGDNAAANQIRALTPAWPARMKLLEAQTDAVLHWADMVLTVSGTATLHVARHAKPMAIVYRVGPFAWHAAGRWIVRTRTFTLPNLIAAGGPHAERNTHLVREFVPFWGDALPIVAELVALLKSPDKAQRQVAALKKVIEPFASHRAGPEAADAIAQML